MPRPLTAAFKTAAEAEHVRVMALVSFDFGTGFVRATSAPYDVTYDLESTGGAETYLGLGQFGKISPVEEAGEIKPYQMQFELSGVAATLVSTALNEDYQGRSAKLWFALMDEEYAIIADPQLMFDGLMDTMDIRAGAEGVIVIIAQSRLARWEIPISHRWNDAAQQARFPGDLGFEFAEQMVEKVLVWPGP